jgi:hypothetical protein
LTAISKAQLPSHFLLLLFLLQTGRLEEKALEFRPKLLLHYQAACPSFPCCFALLFTLQIGLVDYEQLDC